MQSQTWNDILHSPISIEDLIKKFDEKLQLSKKNRDPWDYDQLILTRAILDSKLCSIPPNNVLWSKVIKDKLDDLWWTRHSWENLGSPSEILHLTRLAKRV